MTIEQRLTNLENLVNNYMKAEVRKGQYNEYDKSALRHTDSEHSEKIEINASDIADNRTGIEESFEASLANSDDIADVRTALEEVYEMINGEE